MKSKRNKKTESVRVNVELYERIQEISENTGLPKSFLMELAIRLLLQECGDVLKAFEDPDELKNLNALSQQKKKNEE